MKVLMRKHMGALRPASERAAEEIARIKEGQEVLCEVKRARNGQQFKLYWALIDMLWGYTDQYSSKEDLSDAIKVAVGHCEVMTLKSGTVMARPKSIAFGNLPQDRWEQFFDKVITFASAKIGSTNDELRAEIEAMVGPSRSAA